MYEICFDVTGNRQYGAWLRLSCTHFEVAKLGELLAAVVKPACEWFDLLVDDLVSADVASLGKCLAANLASVWSFPGMPPFVCLQRLTHVGGLGNEANSPSGSPSEKTVGHTMALCIAGTKVRAAGWRGWNGCLQKV